MNRVTLTGHLGQDPQVKAGDTTIARISLATKEKFKNRAGEPTESTEWHKVVFFGKTADVIGKYAKKGTHLLVEGKIKTRSYEKDNETKYITEINANTFEFLGGPKKDEGQSEPARRAAVDPSDDNFPEDLPF